ncbi:MAG: L-rhamnose mutarotase [Firmicutes bacterium]|nr:L-rhamnose mutarotase [Bacillota bacterium]MCL5971418.1 L-rhamnose mutarotase [Bacillota bacterium]
MQRYGSVIRLRDGQVEEYKALHRNVWPRVQEVITQCHMRNYSIFYKDGWLFSYFEYEGENYQQDMDLMAADPTTQQWWELCKPCQTPLPDRLADEWWSVMEEVYHQD